MYPVIDRRGLKFQYIRLILRRDDAVVIIQVEHSFFDFKVRNQKRQAQDGLLGWIQLRH